MYKFLKTVATALAIVIALIQITNWISKYFAKELTATVRYGAYKLPTDITNELEVAMKHSSDTTGLKLEMYLSRFNSIYGYYSIDISNESHKSLSNIKLRVPDCLFAQIIYPDDHKVDLKLVNTINIGTAQPQDKIFVFVWTRNLVSKYSAKDIILTHDAGIGDVNILEPLGSVYQTIDMLLPVIEFSFYTLLVGIIFVALKYYYSKKIRSNNVPQKENSNVTV